MTDICNELKGAFNAAGVPQRFRGTCVSPAASWRFLTVDVDGDVSGALGKGQGFGGTKV